MRRILVSVCLATVVLAFGCGGGIMKSYSMRQAREDHAAATAGCDVKTLKSEVVREITDRPPNVDYLAIVRVKGCGPDRDYLCGNYLCDEGNYCNKYVCKPAN